MATGNSAGTACAARARRGGAAFRPHSRRAPAPLQPSSRPAPAVLPLATLFCLFDLVFGGNRELGGNCVRRPRQKGRSRVPAALPPCSSGVPALLQPCSNPASALLQPC